MSDETRLGRMFTAQCAEIEYRRKRENEIFTWSSTIFVGFVGAAALFTSDKQIVLLQTWRGAVPVAVVMAIVAVFSVKWQLKQRKYLAANQQMLVEIEAALSFYEGEAARYPKDWKKYGTRNVSAVHRAIRPSKVLATLLLGVVAVLAPLGAALYGPMNNESAGSGPNLPKAGTQAGAQSPPKQSRSVHQ